MKKQTSSGEDRISLLPESVLCHILSFLTTEETVWTSVLSSRWRNLWKWVPTLDLNRFSFPNGKACADFIHKFLNFLSEFKLTTGNYVSLYEPCLRRVIKNKVQHLQVDNKLGLRNIN
ncbi:F-box/FBD/LRR-repeat protein [Cardamine amara subsp. amara]|uniref:F-box/FBD/LRR-repeat protein n=1 Tax=Cardamine amara subsp. amara TaxID=228776 RepID=A0ABD0ZWH6_CARAN